MWLPEVMRHHRIVESGIRQAARSQGAGDLAAVVLETNGSLSVITRARYDGGNALTDVSPPLQVK
ncbi:hypothetical protein [Plantactinospora sp. KLBMP9567]|uniref:hypothetical protein n=1 Tax=Plantactinospora sp. KLBMP9567 TaxID=3085900 RepID=UPI0029829B29|nr:hypothetical protein [Plantactinospora sp. KLBMP9567]MDW5329685.1 hypothetical protein [Plantactinospora sp. KLBMP9567]